MGISSTNGSSNELLIKCSLKLKDVNDPLKTLVSLQEIFKTDVFKGYESWKFTLDDYNLFCISTNKKGLFKLLVKNGYMTFYDSDRRTIEFKLSGDTLVEVFNNFDTALSICSCCEIFSSEENNGNEKKFKFVIKKHEEGILRTKIYVENYRD